MKNLNTAVSAGLLALTLAIAPGLAQASSLFGQNLIVNGDAESGTGGNGTILYPIPGFSVSGGATVTRYATGAGFPVATDPGPADRGLNFFSGGGSNTSSSITQMIDISAAAATIDLGHAGFDLSAYLGGFASQNDHAVLQISFLDVAQGALGNASIGPVGNVDRGNITGLLLRETTGHVPVGTRFIDVALTMTRTAGSYNDGYADNLSLVLQAVPEPSSYAMLLAGLGTLAVGLRRRKQRSAA